MRSSGAHQSSSLVECWIEESTLLVKNLAVVVSPSMSHSATMWNHGPAGDVNGNPEIVVVPAPTTLRSGRGALAQLVRERDYVDTIFCSSDLLALGVMTEAHALGIQVPAQLAVVGFGDLDFAADLHPALTTVHINGAAIGRQAAQFIVDRAEGRKVDPRVVDIGFSIVDRQST